MTLVLIRNQISASEFHRFSTEVLQTFYRDSTDVLQGRSMRSQHTSTQIPPTPMFQLGGGTATENATENLQILNSATDLLQFLKKAQRILRIAPEGRQKSYTNATDTLQTCCRFS